MEKYLIEGNLTGLSAGGQLTLTNNGGDSITLTTNGPFSFDLPIAYNGNYLVAVVTQPVGQTCTVANYSGIGLTGNVFNVDVVCSENTYPISGTLSGLTTGMQVVLDDNGGDALTLTVNGTFTFVTPVSYQGSYNVTVGIQPTGETCTVSNGTGISVIAPVNSISVLCATNSFTIGGQLTGLASGDQVTLDNNGADALILTANGTFTFATPVAYNGTYNVTVGTQPSGQTCTVGNGSGIATAMNITNIAVVCSIDQFAIGGNLSGLGAGDQLVLNDNGGNALTLAANGAFMFAMPAAYGGSYDVTVATQPVGQTCTVSDGVGGPVTANVTNLSVLCAVDTYTIGGSVSGLTASGLVLKDNGGDALSVTSGSTSFQFATPVAYNSGYNVTVFQQPLGQTCVIGNASATAVTANVTNISIICSENSFSVGGTVSGLSGSVTLLNNGTNSTSLTANGSFTFSTSIAQGSSYNVTVGTQPATETCTVTNGTGTMGSANVTNVSVICSVNAYTVGGTLSGLSGSVTLLNNGTNSTSLTANGSFTFSTSIAQGNSYNVTVGTQPATQACTVTNGTGIVAGTNITNVQVNCATNGPTLSTISPVFGPVAGGTVVTLTGTNFIVGNTSVTIGGAAVTPSTVTSTMVVFTTPAHITGNVSVTVTTPGGTSSVVPGGFTYEAIPTATSLSPTSGPIAGGTSVTVTGTNFVVGNTSATIGGTVIPSSSVTVNSSTSLTFSTPPHAMGNVSVTVTTPGGTSSVVPGGFTYEAIPTATSLSPTSGPIAGGTSVTVTGTNFVTGDTSITIGGTVISAGSVTVSSATSLTFSTPAHASGNVAVSVATSGGGGSNTVPGGFTYEASPTITSISPTTGSTAGGTAVMLTGTNLTGVTSVTVGGIAATSVTVLNATSLKFNTPAYASGSLIKDVVVTNSVGSGTLSNGFTYVANAPTITSITPTSGSTAGGTSVTATGTNFVAGTTVTVGGVTATGVSIISSTSLTFIIPAYTSGSLIKDVVVNNGVGSATLTNGFIYVASAPTITSITPTSGPIAGGTSVTATGTNFVAGTTVTVGGVTATGVSMISSTSLTFITPAYTSGPLIKDVVITNSVGSATLTNGFTYAVNAPTITSITPTSGPIAGGTSVTIAGTGFVVGNSIVTINGTVVTPTTITATSIKFVTPASASAGNVAVTVTTPGGTSNNVPGGYTYESVPTTASLTPISGTTAGGTSVTIIGTNFVVGDTSVTIGGIVIPATSVTVNSATLLTFSTPAHTAGNVAVTVATSGGGISNPIPGGFTYGAPPTIIGIGQPSSAPTTGGSIVTINGTNFYAGTTVTIGGIACTSVTIISETTMTCTTPPYVSGSLVKDVTVNNGFGSATVTGGFYYTAATPTLTSIAPTTGPTAGGTTVTATGTNFVPGTTVTVGGIAATGVSITSATSLSFNTPAYVSGALAKNVVVNNGTGTATLSASFTYQAGVPTITSIAPTTGPTAGGTSITAAGTNFISGTTVTVGGVAATNITIVSGTSLTFNTPAYVSGPLAKDVVVNNGTGTATLTGGFTYIAPTYTVTPSGDGHESIAPSTAQTVNSGSTQAFTVTANSGYTLSPVGGTCPAGSFSGSTYTTGAITANCTVTFIANINTYTVGGSVSGLSGTVTLQNNGANNLLINANGSFTFSAPVAQGSTYNVTVFTQPASQSCTIINGSGVIGSANVTNVGVICVTNSATIISVNPSTGTTVGGTSLTLTGTNLASTSSVTLGGVAATIVGTPTATSVTITTPAHAAGPVSVVVTTAAGSTTDSNAFTYIALTYTVTPSGDGHETISPSTAQTVNSGSTQAFTVTASSGYALSTVGGTCPAGSFSGSTYTTGAIAANCTVSFSAVPTYTIGGTVLGLAPQYSNTIFVTDIDNSGYVIVGSNGTFTLNEQLPSGTMYSLHTDTVPYQTCSITGGTGNGTVGTSNVTNVTILCSPSPTNTISGAVSGIDPGGVLSVLEIFSNQLKLISTNGSFTFTGIPEGAQYSIQVLDYDDPAYPSASCSVQNGNGVMFTSNITNVKVTCSH